MADNEQNDDIILYDDEPDPLSMTEEEYNKAKESYMNKVRIQSEKMGNNRHLRNTQPI
jgi:hypothetical protein